MAAVRLSTVADYVSGEELAVDLGVDPKMAGEERFPLGTSKDTVKLHKVKRIDGSKRPSCTVVWCA